MIFFFCIGRCIGLHYIKKVFLIFCTPYLHMCVGDTRYMLNVEHIELQPVFTHVSMSDVNIDMRQHL